LGKAYTYLRMSGSAEIGQNLRQLSQANLKLDRMLAKIGTKADNAEFRQGMTKERNNAKKVCKTIMTLFKQCDDHDMVQKYSTQFKTELDKFTEISKAIEVKEREVVGVIHAHQDHLDESPAAALLPNDRTRQQQQMDLEIQFSEYDAEEIRRREEGIRGLEQDVKEVAEMFTDLANLVNEQQETLDMIDNNITAAKNKTGAAHEQLRQAEDQQKKSRKKNCCLLFLVLAVVGGVTLGFIVAR